MGVPRRTPEELEPSWIEAYRRWTAGESLPAIAAAMSGAPHWCGSKTTAQRWVRNGQAVMAAKGDPLRKARAQRERLVDALDAIRVEADLLAKTNGDVDPIDILKVKMAAIEKIARIGGYEAPRVRLTGKAPKPAKTPPMRPELTEALNAMDADEVLEFLGDVLQNQDGTLPDGRNQR